MQVDHLLEREGLGKSLLDTVNERLRHQGFKIGKRTTVDATIICAISTTNRSRERDPEMNRTAKSRQWYFGIKSHVAVETERNPQLASAAWRRLICCTERRVATSLTARHGKVIRAAAPRPAKVEHRGD